MTAFKSFTEFTNVGKFKLCSARTSKGFHEFVSTTGVFPEEKWFISLENLSEQVQENIKDFILIGKCDVTKEEAEKTNNNSKKNVYIETKDGFNLDPEFVQHVMLPERYGENTLNVPSHEYYRVPHMYLIDSETINDYHVDVLDKVGLQYTGSFRNNVERNTVKIVEVKGKRIAVLAYTYGCEGVTEDFFFNEKN